MLDMTTIHKRINGICYIYERAPDKSLGRCPEHNPPKKAKKKA